MIDKIHFDGIYFHFSTEEQSRAGTTSYFIYQAGASKQHFKLPVCLLKSFVLLLKFLFSFRIERNRTNSTVL